MAKRVPKQVTTFKASLRGQPEVWRRIAIRADQTLDDLHEAIYEAFDREEEHLYSFYFPRPGYRGRDILRNSTEYTDPAGAEEADVFSDEPAHIAAKTKIASLALKPRQRFWYLFDFGDEWWHEITVESVDLPAERGAYPRILEAQGKSPPQYPESDEAW